MKRFSLILAALCIAFLPRLLAQVDSSSLEAYLEKNNIQAKPTKEGVYYTLSKEGTGPLPRTGEYLKVSYTGKLTDQSVFDQTPADDPFVFQLGYNQVIRGLDIGISYLKTGSKATLYIPAALAYGDAATGSIPANASLIYEVEILGILTREEYDRHMTLLEEKERKAFEAKIAEQFIRDKKDINNYALDHKLKTKRTASGLSYGVTKSGKGPFAKNGDTLRVHYEGFLLDGKLVDSTTGKEPFQFVLGKKKVIDGWEEGFTFFNKGSEGWLLIPSKLAYGPSPLINGTTEIPANSVLIFHVKVDDIIP